MSEATSSDADTGSIDIQRDGPVAFVWLDRPEKRNAFDDIMAGELEAAFASLEDDDELRVVVLAGRGKSFCAGGDLAWMRRVADYSREENLEDARAFQAAYERIDHFPTPVIARVHGAALGGGAGLLAVADLVVAEAETKIGFPEVHLGLVPGVISPYVLSKIGMSQARRYFLTGERFDARTAATMGLVHEVVVGEEALDDAVGAFVSKLCRVSPDGAVRAKGLLRALQYAEGEEALRIARKAIADARGSSDGKEGTRAFLEKRKARWLT